MNTAVGGPRRQENNNNNKTPMYSNPNYKSYHSIAVEVNDAQDNSDNDNDDHDNNADDARTRQEEERRMTATLLLGVTMLAFLAILVGFTGGLYYAAHYHNRGDAVLAVIHPLPEQERTFQEDAGLAGSTTTTTTRTSPPIVGLPMAPPVSNLALLGNPEASSQLIYLHHAEAYDLLLEDTPTFQSSSLPQFSRYSQHYFLIASGGWDVQINQSYCGVASSAAVLNSLKFFHTGSADLPADAVYAPYRYVTQHDVWNACSEQNVIWREDDWDGVVHSPGGLGVDQVAALLQCHLQAPQWQVTAHHLDSSDLSVDEVREMLKAALQKDKARVLVNYHRATAGQMGGGHWSPLGSYSVATDSFLVLDVAKYKYPPVWIPTATLYESMATRDWCGQWNFPQGQQALRDNPALLHAPVDKMNDILGCQPAARGFVVVEQVQDE